MQRLSRHGENTSTLQEILLHRWHGDWRSALRLSQTDDSKQLLDTMALFKQGSVLQIEELKKLFFSSHIDVVIGARALWCEWNLINGRFHSALQAIKPLCAHKDFYPRNIGLIQRSLIHNHLGQRLLAEQTATQLKAWNISTHLNKIITGILAGTWTGNYLDTIASTVYLRAKDELDKTRPNRKKIALVAKHLDLADRALLLSNPLWRPFEKELGLPPPPKTR